MKFSLKTDDDFILLVYTHVKLCSGCVIILGIDIDSKLLLDPYANNLCDKIMTVKYYYDSLLGSGQ